MDIYSYLETIEPDHYVGVDALTVTAKDEKSILGISAAIQSLEHYLDVEDTKQFKYNGAVGWTKGPVAYAMKHNALQKKLWAILMVRGPIAQEVLAYKVFDLRATRVDLRADVKLHRPVKELARIYYDTFKGDRANARLIDTLTGSTFYPETNRSATYYGRLYDKSAEYGEDLGTVWRYEVEIKRSAADQIADILLECHDIETFVSQSVFGIMSEQWQLPVPANGVKPRLNYVGITSVTTEKKLDWIKRIVAPTARKLQSLGLEDELIEALGIDRRVLDGKVKQEQLKLME